MKIILVCVALFANLVAAYSGPYAALTDWYYNGCNATNNFIYALYLYPADGSCFAPTGGLSYGGGWSFTITTVNSTAVNITQYYDSDCSTLWSSEIIPIDACTGYYQISIFQTMPSDQYWLDQGYVGYYGPWETVLTVDYYTSPCQGTAWVNREILGWEECYSGSHIYCQNNEMHYDACTDTTTCASGCIEDVYDPLSDTCTATANAPIYWSSYIDDYAAYYQTTCAGAVPSPSPSPSASPSAVPNDNSSSDEPSEGVWILLLIIVFLLGIIIGLLVGFAIYTKLSAKKKQAENGYVQLSPYPMPVQMYPAAYQ